ncbi:AIS_HP2_G0020190.mRNA.1.CDS.1 [Saccharomyces cerevisiae]|nr:AIS_HP2_G0020190.mRNA.1.CDS.1 [Saccharomyces cerevisiae]CAI6525284.1 AIS_HP2_G0020190.mRNA.1.CDS.1 [Saccharomyces cerevisiae]
MFSIYNSPCVFEQLPTFNEPTISHHFERSSPMYYPECKRRRAVKANLKPSKGKSRDWSQTLKYALTTTPNGYTLSLYKQVPYELISKYVNEKLDELKESHYRPTYHVVQDFFGNQYYVEDEVDENALFRSALKELEFKAIGKKIAKDLFQDYEIELNHRGDELSILSKRDNIFKDFCLDQVFEDVFVISCGIENMDDDSRDKYALLKIGLVRQERKNITPNASQQKVLLNEPKEQPQEDINTCQSFPEQEEVVEPETSLLKEEQIKKWIEEERIMQEESRKAEKQKLAVESVKRQKKEKQAKLKAKKESLIKRQKSKRAEQKKIPESNSSTFSEIKTNFKDNNINTDFAQSDNESINSESDTNSDSSMSSNALKNFVSPVLEDVEDEEVDRYNESLSRSPKGNSIIEDM